MSNSDEKKARVAANMRAVTRRRREQGICVTCGKEAQQGKAKCRTCQDKANAKTRKAYSELKDKSACLWCGQANDLPGIYCAICKEKHAAQTEERKKHRKANGLCVPCGKTAEPGKTLCIACIARMSDQRDRTRKDRLARGLCFQCGKRNHAPSAPTCVTCFLRVHAGRLWRNRGRWHELEVLFHAQHGRCPLTGVSLQLGVNTSIDHIIPKAKGGGNEIENLQWVDLVANKMKGDLYLQEFVAKIAQIHNHFQSLS